MITKDRFIWLLKELLKESNHPKISFKSVNLPDPNQFPHPTITLPKETVVQFRDNYGKMLAFASIICNVELDELCPMHFIGYAHKVLGSGHFEEAPNGTIEGN